MSVTTLVFLCLSLASINLFTLHSALTQPPQKPSLCQSQSDTGSTGEVRRPWGHTNDGASCRLVRCATRRWRVVRCLEGESKGSVPQEVINSLGELTLSPSPSHASKKTARTHTRVSCYHTTAIFSTDTQTACVCMCVCVFACMVHVWATEC